MAVQSNGLKRAEHHVTDYHAGIEGRVRCS
jgi:hypothetical protein